VTAGTRILAGALKGRRLRSPPAGIAAGRPTTDRARVVLFDTLGPLDGVQLAWDLFAGVGTLGLEALSRGASAAVFVESDRRLAAVLASNVTALGLEGRAMIQRCDAIRYLESRAATGGQAALILADPPYASRSAGAVLERVASGGLLLPVLRGGWLVLEHDKGEALPREAPPLVLWRRKMVGRTVLSIYRYGGIAEDAEREGA
jgi:16S rRNA (guanine966-N2)-methyltransferase